MTKSLLKEITQALARVTQDDIARARGSLVPMQADEERVAVIDDQEALKLHALSNEYERQASLARHAVRHDARTAEEIAQLSRQANRLYAMEKITREMSWQRMEDAAGNPLLKRGRTFGLRENFTLISCPDEESPIKGVIPLPPELAKALAERMFRGLRTSLPEETEKPKPQ